MLLRTTPFVLAAVVVAALVWSVASVEVVEYYPVLNVTTATVSLADDPAAINITQTDGSGFFPIDVGNFTMPFYNHTISTFYLTTNGALVFSNVSAGVGSSVTPGSCPLPPPNPLVVTFDLGWAFAWSDFRGSNSIFLYRVFPAGECPYEPKANEACLVIQFLRPIYHYPSGGSVPHNTFGDVTAVAFESGDLFGQVTLYNDSTFGTVTQKGIIGKDTTIGVLFGISDAVNNRGFLVPEGVDCSILNNMGWQNVSTLGVGLAPGQTFSYYFSACAEGQTPRTDGYGCMDVGAASFVVAAWLQLLHAILSFLL